MRKLLLILLALISQPVVNCTVSGDQDQVLIRFAPHLEGSAIIQDENKCFHLIHEEETIEIQNCFVDAFIRNCTPIYLIRFFENGGYLVVNQFDDEEIYIKAKMRLLGGGIGFWELLWAVVTDRVPEGAIFADELTLKRHDDKINKIIKKRAVIDADKFTAGPVVPLKKELLILETKCIVGPGIPIGPCPFPFPGTGRPYPKAPKEIIRLPMPIVIGPTTIV